MPRRRLYLHPSLSQAVPPSPTHLEFIPRLTLCQRYLATSCAPAGAVSISYLDQGRFLSWNYTALFRGRYSYEMPRCAGNIIVLEDSVLATSYNEQTWQEPVFRAPENVFVPVRRYYKGGHYDMVTDPILDMRAHWIVTERVVCACWSWVFEWSSAALGLGKLDSLEHCKDLSPVWRLIEDKESNIIITHLDIDLS